MRRNFIKEGDKTTSGATVIEGFENDFHHGVLLTFVGAKLFCPTCKSLGVILGIGPRFPDNWMGKEQALEGDLGACKCEPTPHLIASQNDTYEEYTADELAQTGCGPNGELFLYRHDEQITLRDRRTNQALANIPYRMKTGSSVIASGKTDANGRTGRTGRMITDDKQNIIIEIQRAH
jgi:uncharacterized Zn-binding protein involved in type VI secretion